MDICVFQQGFTHSKKERAFFFESLLKKKQEFGATRFIYKACILYKCLLGMSAVLQVHFSQNSVVARSAKWKNHSLNISMSLWFSALGAGLSP
jgi:hypothetical protein